MKHRLGPLSIGVVVGLALSTIAVPFAALSAAPAEARDRTLKLYFGHTGERGTFTYKRNGRYDRRELERINNFLRDWRRNEPTRMDPELLDLVWSIYRKTGSDEYIHVISAYRSSKTNDMLRRRSRGVARKSQHTLGKALDFYIPGVPLDKLRAIAMKAQGGGVGYYPRSGSPFVHVDTGNVRAWPRMSRKQLATLFPRGETMHLPADGKPLPGYAKAKARRDAAPRPALAYLETDAPETDRTGTNGSVGGWLKRVFKGREGEAETGIAEAPAAAPVTAAQDPLIAAFDADADTRRPRARPGTERPLALAAALPPQLDQQSTTLAAPPLPRFRPDPVVLAASLDDGQDDRGALAVDAEDAIALLVAKVDLPPPAPDATSRPIELAFAAAEEATVLPSAADRAIIAAFATLDEVPEFADTAGSPMISAALPPLPPAQPQHTLPAPPPTSLAAAQQPAAQAPRPAQALQPVQPPTQHAQVAAVTIVGAPAAAVGVTRESDSRPAGIVLAPGDALPRYRNDQPALERLLATPATYDAEFAVLTMPQPASAASLYGAPDRATLAALGTEPELTVDRFAATEKQAEESFFSRLFANLVK